MDFISQVILFIKSSITVVIILSFLTPILIYLVCEKVINKPLLNIPICILLFLYSVYDELFSYRIRLDMDINIIKNILDVFNGDSIMLFFFLWLPGIISFIIINIAGFVKRRMHKEGQK